MSRILSFKELEAGLPTRERLTAIANALMTLRKARIGNMVVFGSVAWGAHSWRSDIDVAVIEPPLEASNLQPAEVVTGAPGSVLKLLACEPEIWRKLQEQHHLGSYVQIMCYLDDTEVEDDLPAVDSDGRPYNHPTVDPRVSPSLRDHFKLLAGRLGGPWLKFLEKLPYRKGRTRTHDILDYVGNVEGRYADVEGFLDARSENGPQLHAEDVWLGFDCELQAMSSAESMPKQLMRKILGKKKIMPTPDTTERLLERFRLIKEPWSSDALSLFDTFFKIDALYSELARDTAASYSKEHEAQYWHEVWGLYQGLPVKELAETIRQAFPCHCIVCEPRE